MRIGVDARELCGHVTGAGRYLAGLLREWSRSPHEFVLYGHEPAAVRFDSPRIRERVVPGAGGTWWEQTALRDAAQADRLDRFFAPAYTAPLRLSAPLVVAIHDVSYAAHPEWFRFREGIRRRWVTRQSAGRARAVLTISAFSKREIVDRLGVAPEKVSVIPPGIDPPPRRAAAAGMPPSPARILYVGSIFNRRHVPDLVRAVALLRSRRPGVALDIVGDDRTYPPEAVETAIAAARLDGAATWHQYASAERLADLYAGARAFAFLSEYEGLGLTPLEALAVGVPPVVADTEVAREAYGDAALYVRVGDVPGAADALEQALFDETTRARLLATAPAALAKYDWGRAAAETLAVIERAGTSG